MDSVKRGMLVGCDTWNTFRLGLGHVRRHVLLLRMVSLPGFFFSSMSFGSLIKRFECHWGRLSGKFEDWGCQALFVSFAFSTSKPPMPFGQLWSTYPNLTQVSTSHCNRETAGKKRLGPILDLLSTHCMQFAFGLQ